MWNEFHLCDLSIQHDIPPIPWLQNYVSLKYRPAYNNFAIVSKRSSFRSIPTATWILKCIQCLDVDTHHTTLVIITSPLRQYWLSVLHLYNVDQQLRRGSTFEPLKFQKSCHSIETGRVLYNMYRLVLFFSLQKKNLEEIRTLSYLRTKNFENKKTPTTYRVSPRRRRKPNITLAK